MWCCHWREKDKNPGFSCKTGYSGTNQGETKLWLKYFLFATAGLWVVSKIKALGGITWAYHGIKQIPDIIGKDIFLLKEEYEALSKKEKKQFKGHLQAVEALCNRFSSSKNTFS